jgi:hypothetical protein
MSPAFHRAVWLDHQSAALYDVTHAQATETAVIQAPDRGTGHIHHKAGTPGPGHEPVSTTFLHQVGEALRGSQQVLILGPADAKNALKTYLEAHFPAVAAKVVGVEAMPRAGAAGVHALAEPIFRRNDRMAP